MVVILVALAVAIVGALTYALASNPKLTEMGRIAFFTGLLWTVYAVGNADIHLLPDAQHERR
jgi:hypothetical protein